MSVNTNLLVNCEKLCKVPGDCDFQKALTLPFFSLPQGSCAEPTANEGSP
jgi:hypothetical protein